MNARKSKDLALATARFLAENREEIATIAWEKRNLRNVHGQTQHRRLNPARLAKKHVRANLTY